MLISAVCRCPIFLLCHLLRTVGLQQQHQCPRHYFLRRFRQTQRQRVDCSRWSTKWFFFHNLHNFHIQGRCYAHADCRLGCDWRCVRRRPCCSVEHVLFLLEVFICLSSGLGVQRMHKIVTDNILLYLRRCNGLPILLLLFVA